VRASRILHDDTMLFVLCALLICLAGCATTDLAQAPSTADRATPTPCLTRAEVPAKPAFVTDAQLLTVPEERVIFVLGSDRLARMEYESQIEAKLAGCVGDKPIPSATPVPAAPASKPSWQFWR